jgi:hypothetical protein
LTPKRLKRKKATVKTGKNRQQGSCVSEAGFDVELDDQNLKTRRKMPCTEHASLDVQDRYLGTTRRP